jgi:hypothetical protein
MRFGFDGAARGARSWVAAIAAIGAFALGWGCAAPIAPESTTADAERTVAPSRPPFDATSREGVYRIRIWPEDGAPRLGVMQAWRVEVRPASGGEPVALTQLAFDGGMPQHGHGFETRPRATDVLADGVVRVDGVRFHMSGRWSIRVAAAGPLGVDFADFEIEVGP